MKKQLRRFLSYTLLLTSMMSTTAFAQTDVHVLDVGQGLSVLIESQGHYMLYDGGDSSKSSYVVSYLQQEGVTSLDYVVASHYDADHLNGVVGALNAFPVSHVWGPDYTTGSKVFQAFQSVTKEHDLTVVQPPVGSVYELGDASIQVLSPSGDDYGDVNNYSIAIRVQDGDTSFLITGDAESESEQEMVSSPAGPGKRRLSSWASRFRHINQLGSASAGGSGICHCLLRRGKFLWASPYRSYGKTGSHGNSSVPYRQTGRDCRIHRRNDDHMEYRALRRLHTGQ